MPSDVIVTRTFSAPRELVYEAWTKPEHFSVWFGTDAVDVPLDTLALDVRVGGAWKATMNLPDGNQIHWAGQYTEVDPPERLSFTMTDDPANPSDVPIVVEFKEVSGGTEMTLTQLAGDFTQEQVDATIMGYNGFFDAMEKVLAAQN